MHPAPSVIVFTALSGLGFGLMAFLGLGYPDVTGWVAFAFFFIAYALAVGGLLASTFHLGNPQRALRAFTQWRTSWLSREGVVAVAALVVMAPYAIGRIFLETVYAPIGWLAAILALVTVYCTSMIYAQLKTVPRWNMSLTPVLFLGYSLSGGALLAGQARLAGVLILAVTLLQLIGWRMGDARFRDAGSTIGTATGLGRFGKVRLLESPHSGTNYLLKEMVHVVGRKHSQRLRMIAAVCLGLVPAALLLALPSGHLVALVAVALHLVGLFASRWLFFAEAEHVVGLYYDKR